jgi:hypothetical protein
VCCAVLFRIENEYNVKHHKACQIFDDIQFILFAYSTYTHTEAHRHTGTTVQKGARKWEGKIKWVFGVGLNNAYLTKYFPS